jgi:hypothetical protein
MMRTTIRAFVAVAVVSLPACSDPLTPTTHPLVGNAYDAVDGCLQPQQSFDVVDGPAPSGTCDLVCVTDAKTGTVYVTNACGPYPNADTLEAADASGDTCSLALAAWAAGNECGASSDAGGDATADAPQEAAAETGAEAATDAGADAPLDAKGNGG